jgi:hypothetical protein
MLLGGEIRIQLKDASFCVKNMSREIGKYESAGVYETTVT